MRYVYAALMAALVAIGCQGFNPIGPAVTLGIYWKQGEASKYYRADRDGLRAAVVAALPDLGLVVFEEHTEGDTTYIRAGDGYSGPAQERRLGFRAEKVRLAPNDKFKIKVTAVNQKVARLAVRVNTFGDKPYAELLFRNVDRQPGVRDFATLAELETCLGPPAP